MENEIHRLEQEVIKLKTIQNSVADTGILYEKRLVLTPYSSSGSGGRTYRVFEIRVIPSAGVNVDEMIVDFEAPWLPWGGIIPGSITLKFSLDRFVAWYYPTADWAPTLDEAQPNKVVVRSNCEFDVEVTYDDIHFA